MKSLSPVHVFVSGFLVGIFVAEDFMIGAPYAEWILLVSVVSLWVAAKYRLQALIFCAAVFLGIWRFTLSCPDFADISFVSHYNGSSYFAFMGEIIREVDVRPDHQNLVLEVDAPLHGLVHVRVSRYPEYSYGDVLSVYGDLLEPASFDDFSYKDYLSRYGVYSVMYDPFLERYSASNGNFFWSKMFDFKSHFEGVLNEIFPEPSSSLAAGLLLGSRRGIPEEVQEYFRVTGLSHIVAISGYNITIVIAFVGALLSSLPKRKQIVGACVFVVLFTVFVGASAAVVRASIMGVIGLAAIWFGRKTFVTQSLLLAAFFMNFVNPRILVYDIGFQLSFAATCGLVYVSPVLESFFERKFGALYSVIPQRFCIRESLFLTVSAQITALPIILLNFGQLSLVSPIANMFVAVLIPWAMLLSFTSAIIYMIGFVYGGLLIGYVAWFFIEAIVLIAEKCSQIPFASVAIDYTEPWMCAVYLLFIGRALWTRPKSHKPR